MGAVCSLMLTPAYLHIAGNGSCHSAQPRSSLSADTSRSAPEMFPDPHHTVHRQLAASPVQKALTRLIRQDHRLISESLQRQCQHYRSCRTVCLRISCHIKTRVVKNTTPFSHDRISCAAFSQQLSDTYRLIYGIPALRIP